LHRGVFPYMRGWGSAIEKHVFCVIEMTWANELWNNVKSELLNNVKNSRKVGYECGE